MIYQELGKYDFMELLRSDEYAKWSYEATEALFDYYSELSDDMENGYQFDRVAIRCEWSEYPSALDAYNEYHGADDEGTGTATGDDNTAENAEAQALEWLQDNTTAIELDNGNIILMDF